MTALSSTAHRTASYLLSLALLSMASCNRWEASDADRQPVYPVSGEISVRGKPAENALVVFHPLETNSADGLHPSGRTGADGRFTLSTYESGDGAPPGEYRVTIVLPDAPAGPNPDADLAADRLKGRYANPATSKLRARVEEKGNVLPPFAVK